VGSYTIWFTASQAAEKYRKISGNSSVPKAKLFFRTGLYHPLAVLVIGIVFRVHAFPANVLFRTRLRKFFLSFQAMALL
jgi:hypothetical protein